MNFEQGLSKFDTKFCPLLTTIGVNKLSIPSVVGVPCNNNCKWYVETECVILLILKELGRKYGNKE